MFLGKWRFFLKAFELFCLTSWRILSELFRYLTSFEGLSRWFWNFPLLEKSSRIHHLKQYAISNMQFFLNYLSTLNWALAPTLGQNHFITSCTPFLFFHFSHLHSPLGKYCCLGYKTIKSQPTLEDCGLRETLHTFKLMRKGWNTQS